MKTLIRRLKEDYTEEEMFDLWLKKFKVKKILTKEPEKTHKLTVENIFLKEQIKKEYFKKYFLNY